MLMEKIQDFILIRLNDDDFSRVNKNGEYVWRNFIAELKELEGFEHDEENECWFISIKEESKLSELYRKYFEDKNQLNLF